MAHTPEHFTIWAEIPSTDVARSIAFYNEVFGLELTVDNSGPNPMAMFPTVDGEGVAGHIYPGTPPKSGEGPTVHFCVPDKLEDAMARTTKAGGKVLSEPVTIPPGRFAYATDIDGNSIGLFETNG